MSTWTGACREARNLDAFPRKVVLQSSLGFSFQISSFFLLSISLLLSRTLILSFSSWFNYNFNTQLFLRHYILQDFHLKSWFIPFPNIEVSIALLPWFYKIRLTTLGMYNHCGQGTHSSPNRTVTRLRLAFSPPRHSLKTLFSIVLNTIL